jgi:hypothetical protein
MRAEHAIRNPTEDATVHPESVPVSLALRMEAHRMDIQGKLEGKQQYILHGQPYWRLFYTHRDDPDTVLQCQLAENEVDPDLDVGDMIQITYLLRTVLEIRRDPDGA